MLNDQGLSTLPGDMPGAGEAASRSAALRSQSPGSVSRLGPGSLTSAKWTRKRSTGGSLG